LRKNAAKRTLFAGGEILSKREEWTEGDVRRFLSNPFYCLTVDPLFAQPHEPLVSEEQWINAAVKMIEVEGARVFLRSLLDNLKHCGR
jgi:hypothetical protein